MKIIMPLAIVASLVAGTTAGHAATIYADNVVGFTKGAVERNLAGRSDPAAALGAADGKFVSLGFGGSIVLAFATPFKAVGQVIEITFNDKSKHPETADIYAGNGTVFVFIASVANFVTTSFDSAGIFTHLKIVDTSEASGASFDGFDIDAVEVVAAPVPLPASALLLAGGLFGLGALRRRAKKA